MPVRKVGFKRVQRMLETMPETTRKHLRDAQEDNASEIVRVAQILVPVGETARSKAAIKATPAGDGQIIDFGPLSKILEGGTVERFHKTGKRAGRSTGKGPAVPFVNPSMKATAKTRLARTRKALRDAVKEAKNNGGA
ncbi:hypothetical protein Q4543_17610 [Salipiger sp. 1_MG-2023]|uniref:hypothetical protein n=1 Tax=Salipiger sp. 1_MG-2023 TaxID=3062665 RepID=UPI0026E31BCA|nr:hypothetical protein [Salipiger sp. 1_MG-2023]MDO6587332.1 hypothetical protein [Salipiger sp. 1_MG-2023]